MFQHSLRSLTTITLLTPLAAIAFGSSANAQTCSGQVQTLHDSAHYDSPEGRADFFLEIDGVAYTARFDRVQNQPRLTVKKAGASLASLVVRSNGTVVDGDVQGEYVRWTSSGNNIEPTGSVDPGVLIILQMNLLVADNARLSSSSDPTLQGIAPQFAWGHADKFHAALDIFVDDGWWGLCHPTTSSDECPNNQAMGISCECSVAVCDEFEFSYTITITLPSGGEATIEIVETACVCGCMQISF